MAIWPELPVEIRLMVLKFVADYKPDYEPESRRKEPRTEPSLATLATVCREWQDHFEAVTFHHLTLTLDSNNYNTLSSVVSGARRQSLVRHLSLWIDESSSPILAESYEKTRAKRNILRKSITWLFLRLSKWQSSSHPGLNLELCASDIQSTDIFAGWDWGLLPSAPVVTTLILPRQKTPWMDGDQFRYLFAATPGLQSFRWEPWQHHFGTRRFEPVSGIWFKRERAELGVAILQKMSSTVKSVSIFSEELCSALTGNNTVANSSSSREPKHWIKYSLHCIAEALTRRGTQLTHLAACYIIDASTFLDMALRGPLHISPVLWSHMISSSHHREPLDYSHLNSNPFRPPPPSSPHPTWQQLETLTLTSRLLNPSRKDETINELFLKAGQLAKRSIPKLKTLEI